MLTRQVGSLPLAKNAKHSSSITSVKIIQLNEYGCRDAPCEKSWKQGNPLSNTIKDTSTIMHNPLSELCRVTHDCASILDSIAKGISLFPRFFAWCIPTSIFIHFYTCSTYYSSEGRCFFGGGAPTYNSRVQVYLLV